MDFEEAERSEPTQALELTEDDIKEDGIVPLRYVKFQNVNSVTVSSVSFRCMQRVGGDSSCHLQCPSCFRLSLKMVNCPFGLKCIKMSNELIKFSSF